MSTGICQQSDVQARRVPPVRIPAGAAQQVRAVAGGAGGGGGVATALATGTTQYGK